VDELRRNPVNYVLTLKSRGIISLLKKNLADSPAGVYSEHNRPQAAVDPKGEREGIYMKKAR
jgi:hypothetical protein